MCIYRGWAAAVIVYDGRETRDTIVIVYSSCGRFSKKFEFIIQTVRSEVVLCHFHWLPSFKKVVLI